MNIKNNRRERGVALIFALGILALMMILGIAFVGDSLMTQKNSINNSARGAAKALARSGANRAMAAAQMLLRSSISSAGGLGAESVDFGNIFSWGAVEGSALALTDTNFPPNTATSGTVGSGKDNDMLFGSDSKLNYKKVYEGKNSRAKWVYIKDSAGKIIGRYAFQILPPPSSSLSLYGVTRGATMIAEPNPGGTNVFSTGKMIPQIFRWGKDGDEINLTASDMIFFTDWQTDSNISNATAGLSTTFYTKYDNFFSAYSGAGQAFNSATPTETALRQKFIKHWFIENDARFSREAYPASEVSNPTPDQITYYNRFNLSSLPKYPDSSHFKYDIWYDRLVDLEDPDAAAKVSSIKNANGAIIALTAPGIEFGEDTANDRDVKPFGLPFLRRIGNSAGSFADLATLRKQIAANLNDYCDGDGIPTSDVPATSWKDFPATPPAYTGNEKTPYVNSLALNVNLKSVTWDAGMDAPNSKLSADLTLNLYGVLIDIYGLPSVNAKLKTTVSDVVLTAGLSGTISGKYVAKNGEGKESINDFSISSFSETLPQSISLLSALPELNFSSSSPSGYLYASAPISSAGQKAAFDFSTLLRSKITAPSGHTFDRFAEVDISAAVIEITGLSFKVGDMALGDAAGVGMDYVRNHNAAETLSCSYSQGNGITLTPGSDASMFAFGLQAKDPRQNLNLRIGTGVVSDWNSSIDLESVTSAQLEARLKSVNKYKAPTAANYIVVSNPAAAGVGCDVETVTDPASTGENAPAISTAVIRNVPMQSPWELGAIHRGEPWKTLNIKDSSSSVTTEDAVPTLRDHVLLEKDKWDFTPGTNYAYGDGAILDEIKMTGYSKSYGKINLNKLQTAKLSDPDAALNKIIAKGLFYRLRTDQTLMQLLTESANFTAGNPAASSLVGGTPVTAPSEHLAGLMSSDIKLRSEILRPDTNNPFLSTTATTDAGQEEVIGKTINLTDASNSSPTSFQIMVVAQTIRDMDGAQVLIKSDDTPVSKDCAAGTFDYDSTSGLYFDEILGEAKLLVTVDLVTTTAPFKKIKIRQIEYLE